MIENSSATMTAGARSVMPRRRGEASAPVGRGAAMSYSTATSAGACAIHLGPSDIMRAPRHDISLPRRTQQSFASAARLLTDPLGVVIHPLFDVLGIVGPVDRLVVLGQLLDRRVIVEVLGKPFGNQVCVRLAEDAFLQLGPGTMFQAPALRRELHLVAQSP